MAMEIEAGAGERGDVIEPVYGEHHGAVVGAARQVLGDAARAEDVAQEVFLRLWTGAGYDPRRGPLRAFLVTLARRRAIDVVRSDRARSRREERAARDEAALAGRDEPVDGEAVRAALDTLPLREREVIDLAFYGWRSYRAVAAELGIPEGTVKTRIRSGLTRLRAAIRSA